MRGCPRFKEHPGAQRHAMPALRTGKVSGPRSWPCAVRVLRRPRANLEKEQPVAPAVPGLLSPLRWRWILLKTRHRDVRFLCWPPQHSTGHRNLRMFDRGGYNIGRLVWVVCDTCRVGSINKISIDPDATVRVSGVA